MSQAVRSRVLRFTHPLTIHVSQSKFATVARREEGLLRGYGHIVTLVAELEEPYFIPAGIVDRPGAEGLAAALAANAAYGHIAIEIEIAGGKLRLEGVGLSG